MKISLAMTCFNEGKNIESFLNSINNQTKLPHEVIIVDGNSTDNTVERIKNYESKIKKNKIKFRFFIKEGNRSVGRNEAIKNARGDIILSSDAGCTLDKKWIEEITKPFKDKTVDVVAGYYKGKPKNIFEKCLIPYVLVMPDKVDPDNFLPASRSMAFIKSVWKKVGGFPKLYSHNEDFVFAKKLKNIGAKIFFSENAIVYWKPRKNLKEAFVMFFRFAFGDIESGIFRPKAIIVVIRYLFAILLVFLFIALKSYLILNALYLTLFIYILWSIFKNYRYVNDFRAVFILPVLQITSDIAVILGTTIGLIKIVR